MASALVDCANFRPHCVAALVAGLLISNHLGPVGLQSDCSSAFYSGGMPT